MSARRGARESGPGEADGSAGASGATRRRRKRRRRRPKSSSLSTMARMSRRTTTRRGVRRAMATLRPRQLRRRVRFPFPSLVRAHEPQLNSYFNSRPTDQARQVGQEPRGGHSFLARPRARGGGAQGARRVEEGVVVEAGGDEDGGYRDHLFVLGWHGTSEGRHGAFARSLLSSMRGRKRSEADAALLLISRSARRATRLPSS